MSKSDLASTNSNLNLQRAITRYNKDNPRASVGAKMGSFYEVGDVEAPCGHPPYYPTYPIHYTYTDESGKITKSRGYFRSTEDLLHHISLSIEEKYYEDKM